MSRRQTREGFRFQNRKVTSYRARRRRITAALHAMHRYQASTKEITRSVYDVDKGFRGGNVNGLEICPLCCSSNCRDKWLEEEEKKKERRQVSVASSRPNKLWSFEGFVSRMESNSRACFIFIARNLSSKFRFHVFHIYMYKLKSVIFDLEF